MTGTYRFIEYYLRRQLSVDCAWVLHSLCEALDSLGNAPRASGPGLSAITPSTHKAMHGVAASIPIARTRSGSGSI
jgi:hypothetical protein